MVGTKAAFRFTMFIVFVSFWYSPLNAQIKILFPLANQTFYPDRNVGLEWSQTESVPVDLMYSQDNGQSWIYMAEGVRSTGYEWHMPLLDTQNVTFKVQVASLRYPTEILRMAHTQGVVMSMFNRRSDYILSALDNSIVELRSSDDRQRMASSSLNPEPLSKACFYPGHEDTVVACSGSEIVLVDPLTFSVATRFGNDEHKGRITAMCAHPTEDIIATATEFGEVCVWSLTRRELLARYTGGMQVAIHALSFSPDGSTLLFAGDEGIIFIRNWKSLDVSGVELRGHGDGGQNMAVRCAQFSPDGRYVVSGGVDYTVRIWDLQYNDIKYVLYGHGGSVDGVKYSADGTRIVSCSQDSTVRQWSSASGQELHKALQLDDEVSSVDYSMGGDTILASTRHNGSLVLWKNIRQSGESDTVSGSVTYPVSLRVGNTSATVGSCGTIPVLFDPIVPVPFFKRSRFQASVVLTLPRRVVEIDDKQGQWTVAHGDERDTVLVPIVFSSNDTVANIPVRFLLSDQSSQSVEILQGPDAIRWSNSVRAFTLDHTINGVVTSEKTCPQQGQGGLDFGTQTSAFVAPLPAKSSATLHFSAYEEGQYAIEVVDEIGMTVMRMDNLYFTRGEQEIPLNPNDYNSALYIVRVIAPSTERRVPFIVLH